MGCNGTDGIKGLGAERMRFHRRMFFITWETVLKLKLESM